MRVLMLLVIGAALVAGACGSSPKSKSTTPAPSGLPSTVAVINLDPKDLVPRENQMIPGTWKSPETPQLVKTQYSRAWDRDPADPGAATGAERITISSRLYLTTGDSFDDFIETATGAEAQEYIYNTITARGFERPNIHISEAPLDPLGVDRQIMWRVAFSRSSEALVQYFAFIHVKNTRSIITAVATNKNGAEAPRLLDEMKAATKKEADYLLSLPTVPQPARTAGVPSPTPTDTP